MAASRTLLIIVVTFASISAQTFQYSRGWTNGKRDGHRRADDRDVTRVLRPDERDLARILRPDEKALRNDRDIMSNNLERILSPCQMNKLRYVLEGKPFNEKLFVPCDYDYDNENPKRYKEQNPEVLFDALQ